MGFRYAGSMSNLAKLRKARGLTQKQLAAKLETSDRSVRAWEAGKRVPLAIYRPKLAKLLKVSIQELGFEDDR